MSGTQEPPPMQKRLRHAKFGTDRQTDRQTDRKAGHRVAPQLKIVVLVSGLGAYESGIFDDKKTSFSRCSP